MLQENINLKPYNTFGMNVTTAYFANFSSTEELQKILSIKNDLALLVLGGGSNILLRHNFPGLTLLNKIKGIEKVKETKDAVFLKVGAGEVWHNFVLYCLDQNLGGVENLSLIPGSVGASPMQNIGAYGVEIKDVFDSLEAVEIKTGKVRRFTAKECEFGYRSSVFKKELKGRYIIVNVTYRLSKSPTIHTDYGAIKKELETQNISNPTIRDVSNIVISIRQSKLPDPNKIGNAGSFFKNPIITKEDFQTIRGQYPSLPSYPVDSLRVKVPAGWLIDHAGWKGKTFGTYGVHKNQALVLVNYGNSNGGDIYALSEKIIQDIQKKYGITLEREVNII